jgi:hypothetical protein
MLVGTLAFPAHKRDVRVGSFLLLFHLLEAKQASKRMFSSTSTSDCFGKINIGLLFFYIKSIVV